MKESKAMMKKEVSFMKKKGAPKSMIRHEEKEYGMKKGVKRMYDGGPSEPNRSPPASSSIFPAIPPEPYEERRVRGTRESMMGGRRMAKGGMAKSGGSFRRAADGIASKGKTKGKMVKMAYGGKC